MTIRAAAEADWPRILELADISVPFDHSGNREWLSNRQELNTDRFRQIQYVSPASGQIDAFCCAEEGPEPGHFRLFAVMADADLDMPVATRLMQTLYEDLAALSATRVWTREDGRQLAIFRFFERLGLRESRRFEWENCELVIMHMDLDPQTSSDR